MMCPLWRQTPISQIRDNWTEGTLQLGQFRSRQRTGYFIESADVDELCKARRS